MIYHFGLAVGTRKASVALSGNKISGSTSVTVNVIETAYNFPRLFDHRFLIFAYRNGCCTECGDIGGLTDGIVKKPTGMLVSKLRI